MSNYKNILENKNYENNINKESIKSKIIENRIADLKHKRSMNHYIIKTKMVNWLLKDFGDNLILLDFLKNSFDLVLFNLRIILDHNDYRTFFTMYCNWIYKNSYVYD